jgi:hypothetical protein
VQLVREINRLLIKRLLREGKLPPKHSLAMFSTPGNIEKWGPLVKLRMRLSGDAPRQTGAHRVRLWRR